jgi:hypothetical protein
MPLVLVSDTSVLVDLQRGGVLETALHLPYEFAVPDLLFERELRDWEGLALEEHLTVLTLDADGVELAVGYRRADTRLSLPDAFALALAKQGGHRLLAGDASLVPWPTPMALSVAACSGCLTRSHDASWHRPKQCRFRSILGGRSETVHPRPGAGSDRPPRAPCLPGAPGSALPDR